METTTIRTIKEILSFLQTELDLYQTYQKDKGSDLDAYIFGGEHEYSIRSIILDVKNIITDLNYLAKSHNLFLKLSTLNDRKEIINHLNNLKGYLNKKNSLYIVSELDWLKSHLRTYCLRLDKSRFLDFNVAIDELCQKASFLEEEIQLMKNRLEESNVVYTEIKEKRGEYEGIILELTEKKDSFIDEYNEFIEEFSDFRQLADRAQNNVKKIADNLEESEEDKETFNSFIEKIEEREYVLTLQAERTSEYDNKLLEYTKEYNRKLEEARVLIEEARKALNYKNAEGLSAAFNSQLDNAGGFWNLYSWICGAFIFIVITIFLGVWIVAGWWLDTSIMNNNQMIFTIVGRLSIIPFTLIGAVFCANQYTKQKNIIEDYAYKTTIAKSIIAFSEELREKSPERYTEYLSTILKEIHQDPLRKRSDDKKSISLKDSQEIIEKVIELLQSAIKK